MLNTRNAGAGSTPLHEAARAGGCANVQALLGAGAGIDVLGEGGFSAMMYAAAVGRADVVKVLLQLEANPWIASTHAGKTALDLAVSGGHAGVVAVMCSALAKALASGGGGARALNAAEKRGGCRCCAEVLKALGAVLPPR